MKKIGGIVFVCLLCTGSFFGQSAYSGKITYEIKIPVQEKESYRDFQSKKRKNDSKNSTKLEKSAQQFIDKMHASSTIEKGVLSFYQQESLYTLINNMENDVVGGLNLVKIEAGGSSVFYSNSFTKKNIEQDCELLGECFLIENPMLKWELKQTTKIIGGYLCYQAISTKEYKGRKSYTIAWYTPQIPVNFGPKGYNGLPGLILELERGAIRYNAIKIELNPKDQVKIKRPTKGKAVTKKEFRKFFTMFKKG